MKCFDSKFPVMLMFRRVVRGGARGGCLFVPRAGVARSRGRLDPAAYCFFFNTLFDIFYSCKRILRCDVYFSANYYIVRSLTVVF